jgi:hypothetical protein
MKKNYFLILALMVGAGTVAVQGSSDVQIANGISHIKYSAGSPSGKTGAPGEGSCIECHGGTLQNGSTENSFDIEFSGNSIAAYDLGETYDITINTASMSARRGFQITALDGTNTMAGAFDITGAGGVIASTNGGTGRKYVGQNSAGSQLSNFPSWNFKWIAPATDVGPVTFYLATNKANGNGGSGGDVIYTSNYNIGSVAGIKESPSIVSDFTAAYSNETSMLYVKYNSLIQGRNHMNLIDMSGRSVMKIDLGSSTIGENKEAIRLPEDIRGGKYFVHFFVDNYSTSKSILVGR